MEQNLIFFHFTEVMHILCVTTGLFFGILYTQTAESFTEFTFFFTIEGLEKSTCLLAMMNESCIRARK